MFLRRGRVLGTLDLVEGRERRAGRVAQGRPTHCMGHENPLRCLVARPDFLN